MHNLHVCRSPLCNGFCATVNPHFLFVCRCGLCACVQILNLVTYFINFVAVRVPGRMDGRAAAGSTNVAQGRFFAPAGWAFAIWAPIFLGELIFVIYQVLCLTGFPVSSDADWAGCGGMQFLSDVVLSMRRL